MATIQKRGPSQLAGNKCGHKNQATSKQCPLYARYVVSSPTDNKLMVLYDTCGMHLPIYVKKCWDEFGTAAVVQEIPGMWR